jgi:hypothetical protein
VKIRAVFDEKEPPPPACTEDENVRCMVGGGNLEDIARVAANAWERVFRGGGRWDLTIVFAWETIDVTHEIGHALGLDYDYVGFIRHCGIAPFFCPVTITAPRPFAGIDIPVTFGPHIEHIGGEDIGPVMGVDPRVGERQLISGYDALLIAQITSFNRPNLEHFRLPPPW